MFRAIVLLLAFIAGLSFTVTAVSCVKLHQQVSDSHTPPVAELYVNVEE